MAGKQSKCAIRLTGDPFGFAAESEDYWTACDPGLWPGVNWQRNDFWDAFECKDELGEPEPQPGDFWGEPDAEEEI
jgi:hypothetical protein